jgi:hypothetical protein
MATHRIELIDGPCRGRIVVWPLGSVYATFPDGDDHPHRYRLRGDGHTADHRPGPGLPPPAP